MELSLSEEETKDYLEKVLLEVKQLKDTKNDTCGITNLFIKSLSISFYN